MTAPSEDEFARLVQRARERYPATRLTGEGLVAVLIDDGRLLAPGGHLRQEWMVEVDRGDGWHPSPGPRAPYIATDQEPEPAYVGDIDAYMRGIRYPKRKVTRAVHTGPWRIDETAEERT